jgi:hypothetical protein
MFTLSQRYREPFSKLNDRADKESVVKVIAERSSASPR